MIPETSLLVSEKLEMSCTVRKHVEPRRACPVLAREVRREASETLSFFSVELSPRSTVLAGP